MRLRILAGALAAGAVVGLVEVGFLTLALRNQVLVRMGPDFVWLVPLAELVVFGSVGALLSLGVPRLAPAVRRGVALGVPAGLAALSLGLMLERIHPLAIGVLALGVGIQIGRSAQSPALRRLAGAAPLVLVAGLFAAGAMGLQGRRAENARWSRHLAALPAAEPGAPNVLLLILDTVRAASLGRFGAETDASPNFDRVAGEGVDFTAAFAPAPWTLPSHASIFTGKWPGELGAGWDAPLDSTTPTLAEALATRGYAAGGFTANLLNTARHTRLDRGFGRWRDYRPSAGEIVLASPLGRVLAHSDRIRRLVGHHELLNRKAAPVVNDEFLAWLDGLTREDAARPWFAFVNYFDAHEPHVPPPPADSDPKWRDFVHQGGLVQGTNAWLREKWRMSPTEVGHHRASYAAAVKRADDALGDLLLALEARGVLDNTIVVIASDHGEQLGERGLYEHHTSLYPPSLHVPLVIRAPGRVPVGQRVDRAITLRDLPATILDLTGVAGQSLPGASLVPLWSDDVVSGIAPEPVEVSPAVAFVERGYAEQPGVPTSLGESMISIVRLPWQYLRNGDGSEEFYDLRNGFFDGPNLAGRSVAADSALRELRGILFRLTTGQDVPPDLPITPRR